MVEIIVTSSVLILVICILRRLLHGKMNPRLQYALWLLVVIRLLPLSYFAGIHFTQMASKVSIMNLVPVAVTERTADVGTTDTEKGTELGGTSDIKEVPKAQAPLPDSEKMKEEPQLKDRKVQTISWKAICLIIYVIGIVAVSIWSLLVNLKFALDLRKNRIKIPVEDCMLPVYTVHNLKTSCIFILGGKCGIYLTSQCANNPIQRKYVIAHEECHYKHLDHIWSIIRCLLLIVYWFDSFVWAAAYLSKLDCEMACDAAVIRKLGEKERFNYGKTLVDIAAGSNRQGSVINLAIGMSEKSHGLKERIQRICKKQKMVFPVLLGTILIVIGVITVTFTTSVTKHPAPVIDEVGENQGTKSSYEESKIASNEITKSAGEENPLDKSQSEKSPKQNQEDNQTEEEDFMKLWDYFSTAGKSDPVGSATIERVSMSDSFPSNDRWVVLHSMEDITDDVIVKNCVECGYENCSDRFLGGTTYARTFTKYVGVGRYLSLTLDSADSIWIDYETTTSKDSFCLALVYPDSTVHYIEPNTQEEYSLPEGITYVVLCGYKAAGSIQISFSEQQSEELPQDAGEDSGMSNSEITSRIDDYLDTGKETYDKKNYASNGLNTNVQSLSYDSFQGLQCLSKIISDQDTKIKGTIQSKQDAVTVVLLFPSNEWVVLPQNESFEYDLPKGETKILVLGDENKGSVEIKFDPEEPLEFKMNGMDMDWFFS